MAILFGGVVASLGALYYLGVRSTVLSVKIECFFYMVCLQVEGKHSSDICSLSNAILHCEALRTHTADAVGIDNVMTALVKRYSLETALLYNLAVC